MATKESTLKTLIEPTITAMGFELWGIDYLAQGQHSRLVIYIDHADGITVDHCADVSRQISALLDVEDPISGQYNLEVSSPGMDRPLFTIEQFAAYVGHTVNVRLTAPFEGRRKFKGLLAGVEGDEVLLQLDDEEYGFPVETIDRAQIVPRFDD
ncbi:ribosome maturation factor RimP [Larsenimonas rhizosphaerae]|uniref:Ribosome maturation factor RimP n=1 Tax=Larsenimonas rhizosphaerae TaxID=2944682 RepID=A0AA41ZI31_9GAMM|nr:ribosome maturation factor RimP [Larsenimonas rhizosphaerae]MCM2131567.1 ribosome maturation factor RimP [Larsenimonas rhizosphaerae]MCX2525106.1 ribosome maturation factor RimP [Larsenimonas rhizosphaerae]